jgi:DNA-binding helix-hairpin-helix protein with protein kinase domain
MGYSYQDLNDGSFFLDPENGDLLICDNDNVTADKRNLGILGKMRYMAPEIVRGDKNAKGEQQMPDVHSDRFSLAVILFMALCLGNPFEGERLKDYDVIDETADYEMFGSNPIFVYHKTDKSNRPIRGYHSSVLKRWAYIPIYIKEAFHRTFVDGLVDRENERTTEIEWLKILTKFRDEIMTCPHCGYEYVAGFSEKKKYDNCPACGEKTKDFCSLRLGRNTVVLELGKKIYASHVDKYSSEYNTAVGIVVSNKSNPSLWGIKLALNYEVMIKDAEDNVKVIAPGGVIPIVRNLKIRFNDNMIGEIK